MNEIKNDTVALQPYKNSQDFFFWLTVIYLFIQIAKPHEVYTVLANIRFERIWMIFLLLCAFFQSDRKLRSGLTSTAIIVFTLFLFISTTFAIYPSISWDVSYNYLKLVIFYFVIIYCVKNKYTLKSFVLCFVLISFLYMALSYREFLLGQHRYDMGVIRMLSWSGTASPNSFGMSCVGFFPFAVLFAKNEFVVPLYWGTVKIVPEKITRIIIKLYFPLALVCIFQTNSRTSFLMLLVFSFIMFLRTRKRLLILVMMVIVSSIVFQILPDETKHRYMSILYTSGLVEREEQMSRVDESDDVSARGRIEGLQKGILVFKEHPLTGVGPGGFQYYTGAGFQTHNLISQVLSEMGLIGFISFFAILFSILHNSKVLKKKISQPGDISSDILFAKNLNTAVTDSIMLFFLGSFFGHTLFQPWWLYLAAFSFLNSQLVVVKRID